MYEAETTVSPRELHEQPESVHILSREQAQEQQPRVVDALFFHCTPSIHSFSMYVRHVFAPSGSIPESFPEHKDKEN